jgi:hypothetical protein
VLKHLDSLRVKPGSKRGEVLEAARGLGSLPQEILKSLVKKDNVIRLNPDDLVMGKCVVYRIGLVGATEGFGLKQRGKRDGQVLLLSLL